MPRRRHDSSSEESDSSDMGSPEARPVKQHKEKGRRRQAADNDSDSSDEEARSKSSKRSKRRESQSDAESSPVKRSVASKVEKAKDKDRKKQKDRGNKRQFAGEEASPEKKRARGGREASPADQRNVRGRNSPPVNRSQRANDRLQRRGDMNREGDLRGFRSPDRNPVRFQRPEERTIGQFLEPSPTNRGKGWDEGDLRGFDERARGYGNRNEPRSRSIDRPGDRRNFAGADRGRIRSRSPQDRFSRTRNDSWRSDDHNFEPRRDRSQSPNRRRDFNRSLSPDRRNAGVFSPPSRNRALRDVQRSASIENGSKPSSQSKKKKTGKKKGANSSLQASDSDIQSPVKDSSGSKKNKSSKKKRDDSVERSFERSKLSLSEENLHSGRLDDFNISKESPQKSKKTKNKRRKSHSDSESASPDRSKKQLKSNKKGREKLFKKSKKVKSAKTDLERISRSRSRSVGKNSESSKRSVSKKKSSSSLQRNSLSRSPSPLNVSGMSSELNRSRSADFNRSRSAEMTVGRNHDMAKFESEPESGEITDSEEEGEKGSRQVLKSQIKKPSEEDRQRLEDEKYWAEKRKASRKAEAEITGRGESKRDRDRGNKRKAEENKEPETSAEPAAAPKKPKDGGVEGLTGRTGGAYIPPARLRLMQAGITDKSSVEYQRISWEALKKSINGLINKVNVSNIVDIVRELFQENIVRGRGLMARSIIQAQAASPTFTHVYAALVAIVNTKLLKQLAERHDRTRGKATREIGSFSQLRLEQIQRGGSDSQLFPQNGELILKRLVQQFRRGYRRNDKSICLSSTRFIAHLVNQQVAHEVLALEVLTLLLEAPTDDSVEVAIGFLKESGQKLTDVTPRGINAIFERLRTTLHEGQIDTRVQYMVEVMFAVRKDGFKDNPAVLEDLDLVVEDDQFTHLLTLEDVTDGEELLNVFRPDPDFLESEEKYKVLKREILDEGSSDEDESGSGSGSDGSEDDSENEEGDENKQTIVDSTETNMVALRRTIYLTIQSSLDFEECAHKLMKMELKPGQEVELCNMILDCCAQMRTYEKFFGLLAGRFCMLDKKYVSPFQQMFQEQYSTIHRLETNKLRNVAKFFAHLLHTDSVSWAVLSCIKLNEEDTTSASRIFIKILFQELSEYLGLPKLNERLKDPTLQEYYSGLMPRDNPRDTRFAINFFTTIGLGGLTDDLRDHLKSVSKKLMEQKQEQQQAAKETADSDSSDASSSDSSDVSSSEEESSESESSESESSVDERRKKKKRKAVEKPTKEVGRKKNKGKPRSEPDIPKDKRSRKEKDRSNGAIEKADKKKDRKDKRGKQSRDDSKNTMNDQFKRLARLANYGNDVVEMANVERRDRQRSSLEMDDRRDRRGNRGIRSQDRDPFEREGRRREPERELFDPRDRLMDPRERAGYDRRGNMDRGYDSFDGRDDRELRRGRKGRDFMDDDRPVQIERNFARMDIYEDKFAREREQNLEYLRSQREFEDYFRGRNDLGREMFERGEFRGGPPRGRPIDWDDRRFGPPGPPYADREFDRGLEEPRRRGRNRSEERMPVVRDERRRRR